MGTTTPDVIYRRGDDADNEGLAVYLDGMSVNLHGDPQRAAQDRTIREWMMNNGWDVITIMANELSDVNAMTRYFRRLATYLGNDTIRERVRSDQSWFTTDTGERETPVIQFIIPNGSERYTAAVDDPTTRDVTEWEVREYFLDL